MNNLITIPQGDDDTLMFTMFQEDGVSAYTLTGCTNYLLQVLEKDTDDSPSILSITVATINVNEASVDITSAMTNITKRKYPMRFKFTDADGKRHTPFIGELGIV